MATITITPGNSFTPTEAVTSTKLNDLGSPTAALTALSIGTADIADANVTFAKLTDVIDDDTMATAASNKLATSGSLKTYIDSTAITQSTGDAPYYGCRAWAHYDMVTRNIRASGNIASITRNSTGICTVVFTEPMPTAYYAISIGDTGTVIPGVAHTIGIIEGSPTANGFSLAFINPSNGAQRADQEIVSFSVFA